MRGDATILQHLNVSAEKRADCDQSVFPARAHVAALGRETSSAQHE